jgi:ribosomal protein L44E
LYLPPPLSGSADFSVYQNSTSTSSTSAAPAQLMGKCTKCRNKQYSYSDPGNGPGRYCKQCATTMSSVVPRYKKEQERAGSGAKQDKDKRARVDGGPPIHLASLGLMPSIIKTLDEDYLERQLSTVDLLKTAKHSWNVGTSTMRRSRRRSKRSSGFQSNRRSVFCLVTREEEADCVCKL